MKNFFEKRIVESSMLDFSNNFAQQGHEVPASRAGRIPQCRSD